MLNTEGEVSWIRTWVLMSPWYLSWVWVTVGVFIVVQRNANEDITVSRRVLNHLFWMIILLISYWAFCTLCRNILFGDEFTQFWPIFTRTLYTSSQLDVFIYLGVLAAAIAINFYHNVLEEKIELKRLQNELTQEQLKTLRSQLNPHFLFNTLNTIASLVRLKREKEAVSALSELSLMLRKILENTDHADVRVKEEVDFINSYLTLQKMRFADKLDTHILVHPDCLEFSIPNMLLHPLVENAVQHGSQLESNQNPLNLEISRDEHELMFVMTNRVARHDNHQGFGIGLTNTRERLTRIYTHFRLELRPLENDVFETTLAIPIGELDA